MRKLLVAWIILPVIFSGCAMFSELPELPEERQIDRQTGNYRTAAFSEASGLNYVLTFPREYETIPPENPLPLIVFLHSLEERGTDIDLVVENTAGMGRGLASFALADPDFAFVTLSPLCPKGSGWPMIPHRLDALLEEVLSGYNLNPDRVYLTGVSMGGMGTWSFAMEYPRRFAAAAPIAGGVYVPPMKNKPEALIGVPLWVFHDAEDPSIPLEKEKVFAEKVEAAGGSVKLTVTHTGRHYIQEDVYTAGTLFSWFLEHTRR